MVLAAKKYSKDYLVNFSRSAPGARELMFKHKVDAMKEQAKKSIEKAQEARRERRLKRAALFTQRTWREKKHIDFQEAPLIAMKHAQEVFASSEGRVEEATGTQPLVVYEGVPVISIGTAEEYEHMFLEESGLTIGLTEHVPSKLTYVSQTEDDGVITDSILLAINEFPVTTLSYNQIMDRLKHSRWPLKLKFRRPLGRNEVYSLVRIHDEIQNQEIKIQALKRKLTRGVTVTKHGKKGRPHITRLFITDTHLFWETKARVKEGIEKIWKESCKSITLYDIRFVRPGKETKQLQGLRKKKISPDLCFSIYTDARTLDFQVSDENGEGKKRRDILVLAFREIIQEMRTSQLFVDKNGNPIRRHTQKKKLRSILP